MKSKKNEKYFWVSQKHKQYKYWIYELPVFFESEEMGNYIFCKKNEDEYVPICFGEGPIHIVTDFNYHPLAELIKASTHVHVHLNSNYNLRREEVKELSNVYSNVLTCFSKGQYEDQ